MQNRSLRIGTAIGGVGFVIFFALGATLYSSGAGRSSDEISSYYADPSRWSAQLYGFAALTVGLVLFTLFVAGLRALSGRREPWSSAAFGTGICAVICLMVANTLWASSAFTVLIERGYTIDPRSHLLMEDAGFAFLIAAGAMGAGFVSAYSVAAHLDRLLPKWLVWLGVPVAVALLAVYWYFPLFGFFVWILAVSAVTAFTSATSGR